MHPFFDVDIVGNTTDYSGIFVKKNVFYHCCLCCGTGCVCFGITQSCARFSVLTATSLTRAYRWQRSFFVETSLSIQLPLLSCFSKERFYVARCVAKFF